MNFTDAIAARADEAHRKGLVMLREAIRASLAKRDFGLPPLAERRDLIIPGPGGDLNARLYVPHEAGKKSPLLLFFHGGGFVLGDIETHDALCHRLAQTGAMRVLSVAYRLAPETPFPAQLEDALAAALWLKKNARKLGANRRALGIGGDSAGGYLAIATAAKLPKLFKAQILVYPLLHLDDDLWADSLATNARVLGRIAVRYIQNQLSADEVHAPSLLAQPDLAALPTLIAVGGGADPCAPDAEPFAERLRDMGAPVEIRVYPWLMHGFANLTHLSATATRAVEETGKAAGELLRA